MFKISYLKYSFYWLCGLLVDTMSNQWLDWNHTLSYITLEGRLASFANLSSGNVWFEYFTLFCIEEIFLVKVRWNNWKFVIIKDEMNYSNFIFIIAIYFRIMSHNAANNTGRSILSNLSCFCSLKLNPVWREGSRTSRLLLQKLYHSQLAIVEDL